MRSRTVVTGSVVGFAVVLALNTPSLLAQAKDEKPAAPVLASAAKGFAALNGVRAVPMPASEMEAVKGLHVHFFTPSKNVVDTPFGPLEGVHLAGDVKTRNNWSSDWGGTDGMPVAPSYQGLCVATGLSGPGGGIVSIPEGYAQCPAP